MHSPVTLKELIIVSVISTVIGIWACSHLAQAYHDKLLIDYAAVVKQANEQAVDRGKLQMCIQATEQSCVMQWGKPCVAKKPGRSPWE